MIWASKLGRLVSMSFGHPVLEYYKRRSVHRALAGKGHSSKERLMLQRYVRAHSLDPAHYWVDGALLGDAKRVIKVWRGVGGMQQSVRSGIWPRLLLLLLLLTTARVWPFS